MIIVSQDKTQILNFNNVQNVRIERYGTHIKNIKVYKIFAGNFESYATLLGTYTTEERAKEVLQEIIKSIIEIRKSKDANAFLDFQQYQMIHTMKCQRSENYDSRKRKVNKKSKRRRLWLK